MENLSGKNPGGQGKKFLQQKIFRVKFLQPKFSRKNFLDPTGRVPEAKKISAAKIPTKKFMEWKILSWRGKILKVRKKLEPKIF